MKWYNYSEEKNFDPRLIRRPKAKSSEKVVTFSQPPLVTTELSYEAYAPMKIYKKCTNERGQIAELPLAFVVAKCYVVGEEESPRKTDEKVIFYRVVFEWSQDGQTKIMPIYEYGKCINSSPAKAVFTSPRECQKFVDGQNAKLLRRKTKELFDDEREAVKAVFDANEKKCRAAAYKHLSEKELNEIFAEEGQTEK